MTTRRTRRSSEQRSRQLRESVIGSHIVNTSKKASNSRVNLGSPRVAAGARRGEINQVMPQTTTRESAQTHAARQRRSGFVVQDARRSRRRTILMLALLLVGALAVALAVSRCAFSSGLNAQMSLGSDEALAALTARYDDADQPYYVLIAAELHDPAQEYTGPGMLNLVRVDPTEHALCFVAVPPEAEVVLSDNNYHRLAYAQVLGGDAELIAQTSKLMGVSIAHYVKVDAAGFVRLVDYLGGLQVQVPLDVDDPDAGSLFIAQGVQSLDGEGVLTLCRADNYTDPYTTQAQAQVNAMMSLFKVIGGRSQLDFATMLDEIARDVKTDLSIDQISELFTSFAQADVTVYATTVPGSRTTDAQGVVFNVSRQALLGVMEAVGQGINPNQQGIRSNLDPSVVTVAVRNGVGIAGAANDVADILTDIGYQVVEVGNADTYVYDETLAIVSTDGAESAAQDLVRQLGSGRVTDASYFYEFDADILLIIGKDWKPLS